MKKMFAACLAVILGSLTQLHAGGVGVPKKEDMPKYLKMLQSSPRAGERALAAQQIGKRGQVQVKDVKDAIEPLLLALKSDSSADVRSAAATALGNIGTQASTVLPALSEALNDKAISVNLAAVSAIGAFGPQARGEVPALRKFASSKKDKKIMRMVNMTIKQINGKIQ